VGRLRAQWVGSWRFLLACLFPAVARWAIADDASKAAMKQVVSSGQLEFVNGGWSMHDEVSSVYRYASSRGWSASCPWHPQGFAPLTR
jgi:hypothetical protein